MRSALPLLCLLFLLGCDRPPDGITVEGDTAYLHGLAAVRQGYDGRLDIRPEPPKLAQRKWLYEHDFEYAYFEADTTEIGRAMGDAFAVPDDPSARVLWGRIVYRR